MKIIKEFILDQNSILPQSVYLPKQAEVISVQNINNILTLIAIIDPYEVATELRTFKLCQSDENIYFNNITYIGNCMTDLGTHYIIEILKGDSSDESIVY